MRLLTELARRLFFRRELERALRSTEFRLGLWKRQAQMLERFCEARMGPDWILDYTRWWRDVGRPAGDGTP